MVLPVLIFKDLDEVIELANNRPWTSQRVQPTNFFLGSRILIESI
ncbi:hypothetical protein ACT6P6_10645 [Priestia endophytica]